MSNPRPPVEHSGTKWYRGATTQQWRSFSAAYLGWMLDIMDLMIFSMVITYVVADFGADRGAAGMVASMTLVASAFGGLIFGFVADRFGRTRAMIASILCYSIGTLLCGLSTDMGTLMLARIIVGIGVGGEWSAGTALVTETWPARHRGKVIAWVQSAFASGYALAAVVALIVVPTLGWRWAFFVGVLPALLALWVRRHTSESRIWMDAGKRLTAVQAVRLVIRERPKEVAVCFGFTATAMFGYWGLFTWIPNYLASPIAEGGRGMSILSSTSWIIIMQVGAAIGFISFGYVADRLGRRNAFIFYFLMAALCVPVFLMIKDPTIVLIFGAVMALFGSGFYSGFGPTFAELFPTEVRALAQGFIYNGARATSALAPAAVGLLADQFGVGLGMVGTAGFYVIAAAIVFFFLPETRGKDLETRGRTADVPAPKTTGGEAVSS